MQVAFKWVRLNDNVHASSQAVTASFAHPIGCAALEAKIKPALKLMGCTLDGAVKAAAWTDGTRELRAWCAAF